MFAVIKMELSGVML